MKKIKKRQLELRFDESDHPRDEHGRFVSKGGSATKELREKTAKILKKKKGDYTNKNTGESARLTKKSKEIGQIVAESSVTALMEKMK